MESDAKECPTCHQTNVSPEELLPTLKTRRAVIRIIKETGWTIGRPVEWYAPETEAKHKQSDETRDNGVKVESPSEDSNSQPAQVRDEPNLSDAIVPERTPEQAQETIA